MARDGRRGERKSSFFIIDRNEKNGNKKDDKRDGSENKSSVGENIADIVKNIRDSDGGKEASTSDGGKPSEHGKTGAAAVASCSDVFEAESRRGGASKDGAKGAPEEGELQKDPRVSENDNASSEGLYDSAQKEGSAAGSGTRKASVPKDANAGDKASSCSVCSGECGCPKRSEDHGGDKEAFEGTGGAFFNRDKEEFSAASSEKEIKEKKKEAYTGTGGAFFNTDKVKMGDEGSADKEEVIGEKKDEAFTGTGGAFFNRDKIDEAQDKDRKTEKDVKEAKNEAFTGTGGAFFNKDKIPPAKEVEKEENGGDKEGNAPIAEEESAGGKTEGTSKNGSEPGEDRHVKIEEDKNESIEIPKESNRANFVPAAMANPCAGSKIHDYRRDDQIVAEGAFFKKRVIFYCFWHQKYFVLLRDGTLVYHKCSGARYAKGKWNIRDSTNYQKIYMPNAWCHPYRFTFDAAGTELYFAYDSLEERDYWYGVLEGISRQN